MKRFFRVQLAGIAVAFLLSGQSGAQGTAPSTLPTDDRFGQQPFSQEVFQQIPLPSDACEAYGLGIACTFSKRYVFQDAVLIYEKDSTRAARLTLMPDQPISNRARTFSYIETLAYGEAWIYHALPEPENTPEQVTYRGCVFYEAPISTPSDYNHDFQAIGQGCQADIEIAPDGQVTSIQVSHYSG